MTEILTLSRCRNKSNHRAASIVAAQNRQRSPRHHRRRKMQHLPDCCGNRMYLPQGIVKKLNASSPMLHYPFALPRRDVKPHIQYIKRAGHARFARSYVTWRCPRCIPDSVRTKLRVSSPHPLCILLRLFIDIGIILAHCRRTVFSRGHALHSLLSEIEEIQEINSPCTHPPILETFEYGAGTIL